MECRTIKSESSGKRILITGGAGFIGSHLTEYLTGRGQHVTVVDDLSTGRLSNLRGVDDALLTVIESSVVDAVARLQASQFDRVFHLAAAVGVQLIIKRPIRTIETNIVDTAALLHFTAEANVPTLLASSSEVYGKSSRLPMAESDDVVYGPTTYSRWSYACTKAIDEHLGIAFHREHQLPVVIARLFNTVGPRQVGDYGMVLPRFVKSAIQNQPLTVYGDGTQSRCFCDVRDIVQVLPALLERSSCAGRVINVGHDELVRIVDLARTVIKVLGSCSELRFIPYDEAYARGFEDLAARQPDLTVLRRETGFAPSYSLEQTILDIAQELRGQRTPESVTEPCHEPKESAP